MKVKELREVIASFTSIIIKDAPKYDCKTERTYCSVLAEETPNWDLPDSWDEREIFFCAAADNSIEIFLKAID